jgi:putative ABC transport system permease protein
VKAYDLFDLARRNLREALLRNSLTTMGISVGVASLVAMLSLGVGLQALASRQLGRSGLFDTVIVTSRQDFRTREDRIQNPNIKSADMKVLDDAARKQFATLPGVKEVYPEVRLMAETRFAKPAGPGEESHFGTVAGLPMSARSNESLDEVQGRFFSGPMEPEAIVMGNFARELLDIPPKRGDDEDAKLTQQQLDAVLGKEITLRYAQRVNSGAPSAADPAANALSPEDTGFSVVQREKKLKIVGVVENEPFGGMRRGMRGSLFIPLPLAESLEMIQPTDLRAILRKTEGKTYYTLIVRVNGSSHVKDVEKAIKDMGFNTFSLLDASKNLSRFFTILDLFLGIFGSLALAVASLGIINTLVMAILERRRESGIMKALGASDIDVKKLFFVEAGAMGALGGAIGVGLGWIIGKVINFGTNIYLQRQEIPAETFWIVPWWLIALAIAFSVLVSLGSGLYPAARAAKLDPVQALRHD